MADLSDVSNALAALATGAVYPNGTSQPSAAGVKVSMLPRWPTEAEIDGAMKAGTALVSVFPQEGMERNTTRYAREWVETSRQTPTITAAVSGAVVTLGGVAKAGNYVTIIADQVAKSYLLVANNSLADAAANLAAQFPGASVSGPVITLPARYGGLITVRVGAPSTILKEVKRQQRVFLITVWAPSPALRATVAALIDPVLGSTDFVALPDATSAWLVYQRQNDIDWFNIAAVYRRDLYYLAEYATTLVQPGTPITSVNIQLEADRFDTVFEPLPWSSFNPIASETK